MRENFIEAIPTDILDNPGVLKPLKEGFDRKKEIYAPNPEDFSGIIPPGIIEDDLERTAKKKQSFVEEGEVHRREKMVADILEGIVVDQFSGSWFANKAEGYYTSEADDLLRGVDVVAEIKSEGEDTEKNYLGLALDVTFSQNEDKVREKLERIWNNDVAKERLGQVRYFESDSIRRALDLPRLIISANRDTVRELIRMYHLKDRDGLEKHSFQYSMLSQIKVQLESYQALAQASDNRQYREAIADSLQSFNEIYDAKQEELDLYKDLLDQDSQYQFIKEVCGQKLVELNEKKELLKNRRA